jgi:hypothetical protein
MTLTRKKRRLQRGGTSIDIRQKPIAVVFSHGGCELKTACEPSGVYRLDANVQTMALAHPGESLTVGGAIKTLLESNVFRYRTFEPLFDMHSMSDFTKANAIYFNLASEHERTPFTSEGKSVFETPLRATEGSLVPNSLFTFERPSSTLPAFGVYLYPPERSRNVQYISLGTAKALRLSDVLSFLKTNRHYDPAIGIGIIHLTCNTFYKDYVDETKVFLNEGDIPALSEACQAIEEVYHKANTEYLATERLGAQALRKKYGMTVFPILSNRRARWEPPEVLAMMKAVRGGRRKTRRNRASGRA